jgi:SAM-dependent methyltransferase
MDKMEIVDNGTRCRICGNEKFTFIQEVPYLRMPGNCLFYACDECLTVYDTNSLNTDDYTGSNTLYEYADLKFYVEYGAGLENLARLLFFLQGANPKSHPRYLDVGAGFGFSVSMAQLLDWESTGVEPSNFGKLGGDYLGVNIVQEYLEESNLPKHSFDYILMSDVIEHVVDPEKLLISVGKYLAPDGVVLVTTPNSEVIVKEQEDEVVDLLSPGYHLTILSPVSLETVFKNSGFEDVHMFFDGGQSGRRTIRILAAQTKGVIDPVVSWNNYKERAESFVEDYLKNIVDDKESHRTEEILYGGALFRLLMRHIDVGDEVGAWFYAEKITGLIESSGWNDNQIAQLEADDFISYVEQVPAYLGMFCYYRGTLKTKPGRELGAAARDFKNAAHLFRIEQDTQIYPRYGWPERALYQLGVIQYRLGQFRETLGTFNPLIDEPQAVPYELWKDIYWKKGIAHLRLGQLSTAIKFLWRSSCRPPMCLRDRVFCRLGKLF